MRQLIGELMTKAIPFLLPLILVYSFLLNSGAPNPIDKIKSSGGNNGGAPSKSSKSSGGAKKSVKNPPPEQSMNPDLSDAPTLSDSDMTE